MINRSQTASQTGIVCKKLSAGRLVVTWTDHECAARTGSCVNTSPHSQYLEGSRPFSKMKNFGLCQRCTVGTQQCRGKPILPVVMWSFSQPRLSHILAPTRLGFDKAVVYMILRGDGTVDIARVTHHCCVPRCPRCSLTA